jgi:erythromycin esterase
MNIKNILSIGLMVITLSVFSQGNIEDSIALDLIDLGLVNNKDENFEGYAQLKALLNGVEIVMLGEESHGDGTTYETKIKLIKYLHQEMGFDLLVFEAGFYDCQKAWNQIQRGEDVHVSLAKSITYLWSTTKDFKPLVQYIEKELKTDHPLIVSGFDNQWTGRASEQFYLEDLKQYLNKTNPQLMASKNWEHLETTFKQLSDGDYKALKKNKSIKDTLGINTILNFINASNNDSLAVFWKQALKSTKSFITDVKYKLDLRDKQMADNLIWLKEQYPNKKIICWGATSHFLYNSTAIKLKGFPFNMIDNYYKKVPMMGHYLKQKYGSKLYTIGFTAFQGESKLLGKRTIKIPKENSLEHVIGKSNYENCLLPLKNYNLSNYLSRPLSYIYMKNNIANVMDAVVFNRNMKRPKFDRNFFLEIYPENKWIKPEPIETEKIEANK